MNTAPPKEVTTLLRLEGVVVFGLALAAYAALDGNWWIFALLLLAPDLSMLGALAGKTAGTRLYNLAHTHAVPLAIGGAAWFAGASWLAPFMLIWVAHIAMDRAIGYGLKYPGEFDQTHLGPMGKKRKEERLAHAG